MFQKRLRRKMTAVFTALAVAALFCALPAMADTTTDTGTGADSGTITINGTIEPLLISVTHEITESYSIDPNSGTITASPISITNNTRVPVTVTVESIASASGGDITFTDVLPTAEDWASLDQADTAKYIALGLKITDPSGWNSNYNTATDWAAASTPTLMGTLPSGATGNMSLVADFGYAWTASHTSKADILIMVNLA